MGAHVVDDLAKALTDGTVSRKQMLTVARGFILVAVAPSLVPPLTEAGSRARKRCRRKGGVLLLLPHGTCRCAANCGITDPQRFYCGGGTSCYCRQTVEKTGFCSSITGNYSEPGCHTSAECNEGKRCIMTDFPTICPAGPACPCDATQACIDGFCRHTYCVPPCS